MSNELEEKLANFWKRFNSIHSKAKEYFIWAEEYDEDLNTYIQPIKEHKDALDHIVRAYSKISSDAISSSDEKYVTDNLDKALGHIYRAFYDCSDILSIVLRKKISNELKRFDYNELVNVWDEYPKIKLKLIELPNDFKELRVGKDVASINDTILDEYQNRIKWLFDIYGVLCVSVLPKAYANKMKKKS